MLSRIAIISVASLASCVLFGVCAWAASQNQAHSKTQDLQSKEKTKPLDTRLYMRAKLANSQKVLEGLLTEDFNLVRKGATQMKAIAEAAHWPTTVDEVYQHHSVLFRRQCDKLVEQADRGDLQAAHYTYLHMSTTCIDCHNYVRKRFRVEDKKPGAPVQLIPNRWDENQGKRRLPPQPDEDKTG